MREHLLGCFSFTGTIDFKSDILKSNWYTCYLLIFICLFGGPELQADVNDSLLIALHKSPPRLDGNADYEKLRSFREAMEDARFYEFIHYHTIPDSLGAYFEEAYELVKKEGTAEDQRFYQAMEVAGTKNDLVSFVQRARLFLADDYNLAHPVCYTVARNLSLKYISMEQFEHALEFLVESQEMQKEHSEKIKADPSYVNWMRSLIYFRIGNYRSALEAYQYRFDQSNNQLNCFDKSLMLHDIGLCYFELNRPDSADLYFNKALKVLLPQHCKRDKYASVFFDAMIDLSIAKNYGESKNFKKIVPAVKRLREAAVDFNDDGQMKATLLELSEIYYLKNDLITAEYYLDTLYSDLRERFSKTYYEKALALSSKIRLGKGDKSLADSFSQVLIGFQDSLKRDRSNYIVSSADVKIRLNKRDRELRVEKSSKERVQRNLLLSLIGLVAFAFVGAISIRASRRAKKAKDLISLQNEMLSQSVEEKEMLMREIHHRVKNNLQVISGLLQLQSNSSDNQELKSALAQSRKRLFSIASIHELLYKENKVENAEMQFYIKNILAQNLEIQDQHITAKINANNVFLEMDKAIPLGLMLNELITNSFKHAFKNIEHPEMCISLSKIDKEAKKYKLVYSDNGIGIDSDKKSLGLRIIEMMGRQLKAEFERPKTDGGFTLEVKF